jgi:5'-phosphate synthase pdxT subunit
VKVGVLALQGAFREQREVCEALGATVTEVRVPEHLDACEALIIPGGESTTMARLLRTSGLHDPLAARLHDGLPVLGTCAGLILCATTILDGLPGQESFGVLDVTVRRNGYGRQQESFECVLDLEGAPGFPGVFIRAPVVEAVGPGVAVLAEHGGTPVLVRDGVRFGATFHPELAGDPRLHEQFLHAARAA